MSDRDADAPYWARTTFRLFSAAFGAFLAAVGVYVALASEASPLARYAGAFVLVLVGGNLVVSAIRARQSWLARLGPLP